MLKKIVKKKVFVKSIYLILLLFLIFLLSSAFSFASVSIEGWKVIINTTYEEEVNLISHYPILVSGNQSFLLHTNSRSFVGDNKTGVSFLSVPTRPLESGDYEYFIQVKDIAGNIRNDSESFELINPYNVTNISENCYNSKLDSNETDVDCGGTCLSCSDGNKCKIDSDCISNFCDEGICKSSACDDTYKNGLESDVDCGGSCFACELGSSCNINSDCISGFCNPSTLKCALPACDDTYKNGLESDVDCGGSCPNKCVLDQNCFNDNDCESGFCESGLCSVDRTKDEDKDEIPDWWELKYGLNPNDPYDADEDFDGDGFSNLEEYEAGTDPTDSEDHPFVEKKNKVFQIIFIIFGLLIIFFSTTYLIFVRKKIVNERVFLKQNLVQKQSLNQMLTQRGKLQQQGYGAQTSQQRLASGRFTSLKNRFAFNRRNRVKTDAKGFASLSDLNKSMKPIKSGAPITSLANKVNKISSVSEQKSNTTFNKLQSLINKSKTFTSNKLSSSNSISTTRDHKKALKDLADSYKGEYGKKLNNKKIIDNNKKLNKNKKTDNKQ